MHTPAKAAEAFARCSCQAADKRGFTYIALLVAVIILGISLTAASRYWSNIVLRDREEELLFRGDQYRQAIRNYVLAHSAYPQDIAVLLQDPQTATKRYLRQKFKDPITGKDFELIRDPLTHGIMGVNSPSDEAPLKEANFPAQDVDFEGKTKYSEWQFVFMIPHTIAPPSEEETPTLTAPTRGRVRPAPKSGN